MRITFVAALVGCFIISNAAAAQEEGQEEAVVLRVIEDAQRAGHKRHDLDGYLAALLEDARFVVARGEQPGPYDQTFSRQQVESRCRLRFRAAPNDLQLTIENSGVTIQGNRADVRMRNSIKHPGGADQIVGELYRLRKTPNGWKVYENRYWPVRIGDKQYDADTWELLDAAVDETREESDQYGYISALIQAFRFTEAHTAAKVLTKKYPNTASA